MTYKDDVYDNAEAAERAAEVARSLAEQAQKRAAGDPVRLALDARLRDIVRAREWAVAEGLDSVKPIEDMSGTLYRMAAE